MARFELGDIVEPRNHVGDAEYYIVTNIIDYTQHDDETPDVECELSLIYPVSNSNIRMIASQDNMSIVAKYNSEDHRILMQYIIRKREIAGIFDEPEYLKILNSKEDFNIVGKFQDMFEDNESEIKTEVLISKMNEHLDLLLNAIDKENDEEISLHKEELSRIRKSLMELEYFKLN